MMENLEPRLSHGLPKIIQSAFHVGKELFA
ncbi:MAG: hypothetical protein RLY14_827 [Planctomycetota bacterium]|jgi:hypothetical protein